jgi:hypothetical protein
MIMTSFEFGFVTQAPRFSLDQRRDLTHAPKKSMAQSEVGLSVKNRKIYSDQFASISTSDKRNGAG